jgi:DNA repair protein RadC
MASALKTLSPVSKSQLKTSRPTGVDGRRLKVLRAEFDRCGRLTEYDTLELLFGYQGVKLPRDKSMSLVSKFGSLNQLLSAPACLLREIPDVTEAHISGLKLLKDIVEHVTRPAKFSSDEHHSRASFVGDLRSRYCHKNGDACEVSYLGDGLQVLWRDQVAYRKDEWSLDAAAILRRGIQTSASSFVIGAVHSTGLATATEHDLKMAKDIRGLASEMRLPLRDYIVVTKAGYSSLRDLGAI